MYSPEEIHKKAAQMKHSHWVIDVCNGCNASIGYRFNGEQVIYDAGCRCEGSTSSPVLSSWKTVTAEVNTLLLTDKKDDVIKYWKLND